MQKDARNWIYNCHSLHYANANQYSHVSMLMLIFVCSFNSSMALPVADITGILDPVDDVIGLEHSHLQGNMPSSILIYNDTNSHNLNSVALIAILNQTNKELNDISELVDSHNLNSVALIAILNQTNIELNEISELVDYLKQANVGFFIILSVMLFFQFLAILGINWECMQMLNAAVDHHNNHNYRALLSTDQLM